MMKKMMALLIASSVLLSASSVSAASIDEPSKWAKGEVDAAIAAGLVPDRLQSDYQKPITRGEFAELLVQTMFANYRNIATTSDGHVHYRYWTVEDFINKVTINSTFEDATEDYIKVAFALGSINGVSDTQFAPHATITRQEAATMLANTIHTQKGFSYKKDPSVLGFKDYEKVANWAKPAVQIMKITDIMSGIGVNFDYKGTFTKEQSIATLLRIYNMERITTPALRGNIVIRSPYDELFYTVDKDSVKVDYEVTEGDNPIEEDSQEQWRMYDQTKQEAYSSEKAIVIYGFQAITKSRDVPALLKATFADQSVKIDYGYMTLTTFTNSHELEFTFKNVPGYSSLVNGYTYGFPKQPVEPKVIP